MRKTVVIAAMLFGCTGNKPYAEQEAREWAKGLGLEVSAVQCADVDTDNDSYVSCTIAMKTKSGDTSLQAIECARTVPPTWNKGCRVPKFKASTGP